MQLSSSAVMEEQRGSQRAGSNPRALHETRSFDDKIFRSSRCASIWNALSPGCGAGEALGAALASNRDGGAAHLGQSPSIDDTFIPSKFPKLLCSTNLSRPFFLSLLNMPDGCSALCSVVARFPWALPSVVEFLVRFVDAAGSSSAHSMVATQRRVRLALLSLVSFSDSAAETVRRSLLHVPPEAPLSGNGPTVANFVARYRICVDSILNGARRSEWGGMFRDALGFGVPGNQGQSTGTSIIDCLTADEMHRIVIVLFGFDHDEEIGSSIALFGENIFVSMFFIIALRKRNAEAFAHLLSSLFGQEMKVRISQIYRADEKIKLLRCFTALAVMLYLYADSPPLEALSCEQTRNKPNCLPEFLAWSLNCLLESEGAQSLKLNNSKPEQPWFVWFVRSAIFWGDVQSILSVMISVLANLGLSPNQRHEDVFARTSAVLGVPTDPKLMCLSLHRAMCICPSVLKSASERVLSSDEFLSQLLELLRRFKLKSLFDSESPGDSIWCMVSALKYISRCTVGVESSRKELGSLRLENILNRENLVNILAVRSTDNIRMHSMGTELVRLWVYACRDVQRAACISPASFALIFPSALVDPVDVYKSFNLLLRKHSCPSDTTLYYFTVHDLTTLSHKLIDGQSSGISLEGISSKSFSVSPPSRDSTCRSSESIELIEALVIIYFALSFADCYINDAANVYLNSKYNELCGCWNKAPLNEALVQINQLLADAGQLSDLKCCESWRKFLDSFLELIVRVVPETLLARSEVPSAADGVSLIRYDNSSPKLSRSDLFQLLIRLREQNFSLDFNPQMLVEAVSYDSLRQLSEQLNVDLTVITGSVSFGIVDTILHIEQHVDGEQIDHTFKSESQLGSLVLSLLAAWDALRLSSPLALLVLESAFNCIHLRSKGTKGFFTRSCDFLHYYWSYLEFMSSFKAVSEDLCFMFRLPIHLLRCASIRHVLFCCAERALLSSRVAAMRGVAAVMGLTGGGIGRFRAEENSEMNVVKSEADSSPPRAKLLLRTYSCMQETIFLKIVLELSLTYEDRGDLSEHIASLSKKGFKSLFDLIFCENDTSLKLILFQYDNIPHMWKCLDVLSRKPALFSRFGSEVYQAVRKFVAPPVDDKSSTFEPLSEIIQNSTPSTGRLIWYMRILTIIGCFYEHLLNKAHLRCDIMCCQTISLLGTTFAIVMNDMLNSISPWHDVPKIVASIVRTFDHLCRVSTAQARWVALTLLRCADRQLQPPWAEDVVDESGNRLPAMMQFRNKNKRSVAMHLISLLQIS